MVSQQQDTQANLPCACLSLSWQPSLLKRCRHQGFHTQDYTPVARGFNTSYGFLQGGEDHYTHWCGAAKWDCHIPGGDGGWTKVGAWDLWSQSDDDFPGHPVLGINGSTGDDATYSGYIFTKRVVDIVHGHSQASDESDTGSPLFIYWALHNTREPQSLVLVNSHDLKQSNLTGPLISHRLSDRGTAPLRVPLLAL